MMSFYVEATSGNHNVIFTDRDWYESEFKTFEAFCDWMFCEIVDFMFYHKHDSKIRVGVMLNQNDVYARENRMILDALSVFNLTIEE